MNKPKPTMKAYLKAVILILNTFQEDNMKDYAKTFVTLRMDFHRKFMQGLVCSTALGTDFFHVLLKCIEGEMEWSTKEHKGEYEDNFRKLIKIGKENS